MEVKKMKYEMIKKNDDYVLFESEDFEEMKKEIERRLKCGQKMIEVLDEEGSLVMESTKRGTIKIYK